MKKITLLILILFSNFGVFGQTFLGKRHFISFGTALSPTIGFFDANTREVKYKTDHSIFPSKIELEYGVAVSQTISLSLSAFYRGLPNSRYTVLKESSEDFVNYVYSDEYQLSTDMVNINLNLKLHTEYAPIGPYVQFSLGYNRARSLVYPTLNKVSYVYYGYYAGSPSEFSEFKKLEPWKETNIQFVNIGFGLGKSQLVTRNFYIDYGVQLAIFLNFYSTDASKYDPRDNYNSPEALKEGSRELTQKGAAANALSSNLFQFYVKFGFSK